MLDLVIKHVRVVRPREPEVALLDVGVKDGRFARIAPEIPAAEARETLDARHLLGFPGVVDAHTHVGIYAPLPEDAVTESTAAVTGGVTTMLTYFRTGQYYLNKGGPYREFFPEVLRLSEGRYRCDYAYHLAPIQGSHVDEMEFLAGRLKPLLDEDFVFLGERQRRDGSQEPVAFLMAMPDYNRAIAATGGRLLPFGWLKFLLAQRKIKTLRVVTLGIKSEYRQRGLNAVMFASGLRAALARGLTGVEVSWLLEDNELVIRSVKMFGGRLYKTYRIYERVINGTPSA